MNCGLSWRFQVLRMTSGSFRSVSRPRDRRKSQSARLRVLASQSEAALDRSETFLRNQDPKRTSRSFRSLKRNGLFRAPHLRYLPPWRAHEWRAGCQRYPSPMSELDMVGPPNANWKSPEHCSDPWHVRRASQAKIDQSASQSISGWRWCRRWCDL